MANNVVTLENEKVQKKNKEAYVGEFLIRNRVPILCVIGALVVAAVAVCVVFGVTDTMNKKGIAAVETIEYNLTANSASLSESDWASRRETALAELKQYTEKKGIVGVRASMLAADVCFAKKSYADSLAFWLKAAKAQEKSYTAPVCYFNAASCSEELGNTADALSYYETAANTKDFYLASHAQFNVGRVHESAGEYKAAADAYQKVVDKFAADEWAKLAQSRLILLKAEGKAE